MAEDETTLECPFCHNILSAQKGRDPLKGHAEHCHMWPDSDEEVQKALEELGESRLTELLENAMVEARAMLAETITEIIDSIKGNTGEPQEAKAAVIFCLYCSSQIGIIPGIVDGPTDAIVLALPMNTVMGLTEKMIMHVVKEHTPGLNPGLVARRRAGEN